MAWTRRNSDESRPLFQDINTDTPNGTARVAHPSYDSIVPTKPLENDDDADPTTISSKKKVAIFASVWTSVFLGALDTTIVATLVSGISSDFSASNEASWLATSYVRNMRAPFNKIRFADI